MKKESNTQKNKDKFGVDHCKLINNSLFGKQIENVERCKDSRTANNKEKVTLKKWHILSQFTTLYELRKSHVLFNKPISTGFMILEIAKFEMNIHYDRLKRIFGDNMSLLYTDTDSFKLLIRNNNPYEQKKPRSRKLHSHN